MAPIGSDPKECSGGQLHVGCFGGTGRTGLYLAGMAKVMPEYRRKMHRPQFDPVLYVRKQYLSHSVETLEQKEFIRDLDVSDIVSWVSEALMPRPH